VILTKENIIFVSDGGEKQGYGSFSWIVEGNQEYARGRGEAEGTIEFMQSFRAEAYGMLAALRYIQETCTWNSTWPTTNKEITAYSDNLSLIQRISWHHQRIVTTPKNVSATNYNTEKAITAIDFLETKNIIIKVTHVKGHQDKKRKKQQLLKEAQMNIEADIESTIALETHSCKQEYSPLPETRAMLYKQGQPVMSKEAKTLCRAYLSQDLLEHVQQLEK
jgi:ribonuclease HI